MRIGLPNLGEVRPGHRVVQILESDGVARMPMKKKGEAYRWLSNEQISLLISLSSKHPRCGAIDRGGKIFWSPADMEHA